jgi:hypothetical protein
VFSNGAKYQQPIYGIVPDLILERRSSRLIRIRYCRTIIHVGGNISYRSVALAISHDISLISELKSVEVRLAHKSGSTQQLMLCLPYWYH